MASFLLTNNRIVYLLFIFWGLALYANSLEVPFYFDDLNNIEQAEQIHISDLTMANIYVAGVKSHLSSRPVANISLALNYYVNELYVEGYHFVNIIIHIVNGILLFVFLRLTFNTPALVGKYANTTFLAFGASLLWFSHPLDTQSVTYIIQRMNSMAAMFFLLAFILYVKGRQQEGQRKRMILFFFGSLLSWALALGSKEIAATLPFFIFLYEWYFFQDLRWGWLRRSLPYLLFVSILFGGVILLYLGTDPVQVVLNSYTHRDFTMTERLYTQFRVVVHYLSLALFPHPSRLILDYDFPLSHGLFSPRSTFYSIVAITSFFVVAVLSARKYRLFSFCIVWFLGNLVVESSFIALEIIYEHRTYLPLMLFFVIPLISIRSLFKQRATLILLIFVSLLFGWWTIQRNNVWRNPEIFWNNNIAKAPAKPRPYSELGIFYGSRGEFDQAKQYFQESLQVDPDFADAHNNLGLVLVGEGRVEEAIKHFQEAVRLKPYKATAQFNLGRVLFNAHKLPNAVPPLQQAARLDSENVEILFYLGRAYLAVKKYTEAERVFKEVLRLWPESGSARGYLKQAVAGQK